MKVCTRKKMLSCSLFFAALALMSCAPAMQTQRVSLDKSDELAASITDKWIAKDTQLCVADILKQINGNKTYQEYRSKLGRKPKIFVAEVNNQTAEAYFPTADLNDELLTEFSMDGSFTMIDASVREKLLKELQYQNDGMVDAAQAKSIGKASGADLMIFGDIRMKPETMGGRTIKDYTVNLRMTDIQSGEEVLRVRYRTSKYSQQKKSGW
jgi:PBP1b-binding outer membrane lipoprotein LpoB